MFAKNIGTYVSFSLNYTFYPPLASASLSHIKTPPLPTPPPKKTKTFKFSFKEVDQIWTSSKANSLRSPEFPSEHFLKDANKKINN